MFLSYDERLNQKPFDKYNDDFEILIKSEINLRMTYKYIDQFNGLLTLTVSIFLCNSCKFKRWKNYDTRWIN